jgi:multisubunit Na+/H+ antiporter MnhF subunit
MNFWLAAAIGIVIGLLPAGYLVLRAQPIDRLVAMQFTTPLVIFVLLLLAVGINQPSFTDLALTLAVLSMPAGLVFAHFVERWL